MNGGAFAVDTAANLHTVEATLEDDAGNTTVVTSDPIIFPVDTRPPLPVTDLTPSQGACAINLDWNSANPDDSLYLIFWDGGDGVWDAADTTVAVGSATTDSWTTDGTVTLVHGTTYQLWGPSADNSLVVRQYLQLFTTLHIILHSVTQGTWVERIRH
jgi:hypothetical protein